MDRELSELQRRYEESSKDIDLYHLNNYLARVGLIYIPEHLEEIKNYLRISDLPILGAALDHARPNDPIKTFLYIYNL